MQESNPRLLSHEVIADQLDTKPVTSSFFERDEPILSEFQICRKTRENEDEEFSTLIGIEHFWDRNSE